MSTAKNIHWSAEPQMTSVTATVDEHVGTLSFANPAQRGALTPEMLRELKNHLVALGEQHPNLRVVVLRGTGENFSSGYAIDRIPDPDGLASRDEIEELCGAIEDSSLVVIAMLRGLVIGAALDIASACDFRLAERSCKLGITPAKLGLVYTLPGTARIHRLVGPDETRMLFYTADLVDADQAATIGLLTRVYEDPAELEHQTYELAARIAARAPLSVMGSKRIISAIEGAAAVTLRRAKELHELRRRALRSSDAAEARGAFAEKRTPLFSGEERTR